MKRNILSLFAALCFVALASAQSTKPTTPPKPDKVDKKAERADKATKPDKPEKSNSAKGDAAVPADVQTAIAALSKEMEAAIKSPDTAVRTAADYFKEKPLSIDGGQLLDLLGKRLDSDPRVDAYVKWRLVGGMPALFDEKSANKAIALYGRLGPPPTRPGGSPNEQASLRKLLSGLKPDDVEAANAQWLKKLADFDRLHAPALLYRNAFYGRLPKSMLAIQAGMQDAEARMQAGHDAKAFVQQLAQDSVAIAAGLQPGQINQLGGFLRPYAGREVGQVYTAIELDTNKRPAWKAAKIQFERKTIEDANESLARMAQVQREERGSRGGNR